MPFVPDRLDRVFIDIETRSEPLPLTWDSRNHLLARMRGLDGLESVKTAFEAVGASRPVTLSSEDKRKLCQMLDAWAKRVPISELPAGIWDLRCRLADDLADAKSCRAA
jgi:hypothetical protein